MPYLLDVGAGGLRRPAPMALRVQILFQASQRYFRTLMFRGA